MEKMELQVKISVDTSELNSAIKKAKRLGGILRSIEKRVDDIAKKQEGIGQGFAVEHTPVNAFSFKKLIDDFNERQPGINDKFWKKIIEDKVAIEQTAAGLSVTLNDRKSFTLGRCMRCHNFPDIMDDGLDKYSIKCDCLEAINGDIEDVIKLWDYASKRK